MKILSWKEMASYKDDKMTSKAFDLRALKPKLAIIIMMIRNRIEKFFFNSRCSQKLNNEAKVFLKSHFGFLVLLPPCRDCKTLESEITVSQNGNRNEKFLTLLSAPWTETNLDKYWAVNVSSDDSDMNSTPLVKYNWCNFQRVMSENPSFNFSQYQIRIYYPKIHSLYATRIRRTKS